MHFDLPSRFRKGWVISTEIASKCIRKVFGENKLVVWCHKQVSTDESPLAFGECRTSLNKKDAM